MNFFKKHTQRILFLLIGLYLTSNLQGQKVELIVDTIFTAQDYYNKKYSSYVLNDTMAVIIEKKGIRQIKINCKKSLGWKPIANFFFEVDGKIYIFKEENFHRLPKDLSKVKFSPIDNRILINDSLILSHTYPSVYLGDLDQPNRKLVIEDALVSSHSNGSYLILRRSTTDTVFAFVYKTGELFRLKGKSPTVRDLYGGLIAATNYIPEKGFEVVVYDLDFNELPEYSQYDDVGQSRDFLMFYKNKKVAKVLYKNQNVPIPENVIDVDALYFLDYCLIENKQGLYGVMNSKGEIVYDMIYEKIKGGYRHQEFMEFYQKNSLTLRDKYGEVIFQGPYEEMITIDTNLFAVKRDNQRGIVDKNNKVIIPFQAGSSHLGFKKITLNGKELIISMNQLWNYKLYNLDGELILFWEANMGNPLFRLDNSGILYINSSTVKKLSKSKRDIINKYDVWITQKTDKNKSFYRFENHQSLPLSEWFVDIKPTILDDVFVVWTKGKKFGIVKIYH